MDKAEGLSVACLLVSTAVGVIVAWEKIKPVLKGTGEALEHQVLDRLPGPPPPVTLLLVDSNEPTPEMLAEVRLREVPQEWLL